MAVAVFGTVGAVFFKMENITDFLYFIGSVFAPMIAIQIADFYILKRNKEKSGIDVRNVIIWVTGFVIYRLLMKTDIIVGNTLPDMIITIAICVVCNRIRALH